MQLLDTLCPIDAPSGSAVALGYFDGVHLGHRAVLRAAVRCAAQNGLRAAAFTFSLPDGNTLKGGRILPETQKRARMEALGVSAYVAPPFEMFRALTPEAFVTDVLAGCFGAKAVFCGGNFTFGARAAGNVELLKTLCAAQNISVQVVEMAQFRGAAVSSTRIRAALEEGRLTDANAMLGAPYTVDWTVRHGKGLGSSRLGTPTINQNYPAGALVPCSGVYLTRIFLAGRWRPSATGIGPRPTVEAPGAPVTCETYVPGFSGDVYGRRPPLEFRQYLCPVKKFSSLEELSALIRHAGEESVRLFS